MSKMHCFAGKDYWMSAAIFYMCRAMGVLPLVKRAHINPALKNCEFDKGYFDVSRWGLLFNIVHIMLVFFCGYHSNIEWNNLSKPNELFWIQNTASALISTLLIWFQLPSLSNQISNAYTVCYMYSVKAKSFSCFLIFLLVKPFVPMFYHVFWLPFLGSKISIYLLKVNYVTIHTAAVQVVISSLCFIATNAYIDINHQLQKYYKSKFDSKSLDLVKKHLENYILVSKFVKDLSTHFGVQFLIIFLSFISRTINFVVFTVSIVKIGKYNDLSLQAFAFTSCYIVFCLFFVCYCCQRVKEEQMKTLIIVRRIRVLWIEKVTEDEAFLLDTYEELMEVTAVEFSACGLFPVNVEQLLNVLGIIATYGLVAAQA